MQVMCRKQEMVKIQGATSRSPPASDPYLFASGEHRVAGGD